MANTFRVVDYDIIYLSYDEPNADKNYADLVSKCPWAEHVKGVKGSDSAHKAAAEKSTTDRFITVDADNIINDNFLNQSIDFDEDTFPSDTIIEGRTSIDYIINPATFNPLSLLTSGLRLLILEDIGSEDAEEFAEAWQNTDGTGLVASANDIIEWDGNTWNIVFDASAATSTTYTTNLNTGVQYRYDNGDWLKAVDGDYPVGTWRIELAG